MVGLIAAASLAIGVSSCKNSTSPSGPTPGDLSPTRDVTVTISGDEASYQGTYTGGSAGNLISLGSGSVMVHNQGVPIVWNGTAFTAHSDVRTDSTRRIVDITGEVSSDGGRLVSLHIRGIDSLVMVGDEHHTSWSEVTVADLPRTTTSGYPGVVYQLTDSTAFTHVSGLRILTCQLVPSFSLDECFGDNVTTPDILGHREVRVQLTAPAR